MEGSTVSADRRRLFLASFLMLFVELVLIRWLGAHIAYLSFFSNFVLLGSFLGVGIGSSRSTDRTGSAGPPCCSGPSSSCRPCSRSRSTAVEAASSSSAGSRLVGLPIWISLPIIFAAVAATMAAIAQGVARLFQRFPPLEAYRLDVLGSVTGIAAFATLSFIGAPPVVWGTVDRRAVRISAQTIPQDRTRRGDRPPRRRFRYGGARRLGGVVSLLPDQLDADRRGRGCRRQRDPPSGHHNDRSTSDRGAHVFPALRAGG